MQVQHSEQAYKCMRSKENSQRYPRQSDCQSRMNVGMQYAVSSVLIFRRRQAMRFLPLFPMNQGCPANRFREQEIKRPLQLAARARVGPPGKRGRLRVDPDRGKGRFGTPRTHNRGANGACGAYGLWSRVVVAGRSMVACIMHCDRNDRILNLNSRTSVYSTGCGTKYSRRRILSHSAFKISPAAS